MSELSESKRYISPTLFRCILYEMLFSFMIAFLFFFFIFFVNQMLLMAKEVLTKRVPFGQVALLIFFSLPSVIAMAAPFASLVGILMTVGRLASDNEILVMMTSGISLKIVFFPAVTVGILISVMSFLTNDVLLPAGTVQFNRLWRKILSSTPAVELNANSVKRYRDTVIVTGGVTGNIIKDVIIFDKTQDGERRVIMAGSAELIDNGNQGISLYLEEAFVQSSKEIVREDYDYAKTSRLTYSVSNENIMQAAYSISPREMSSRDVRSEIIAIRDALQTREDNVRIRLVANALPFENIIRAGPDDESWNRRTSAFSAFNREVQSLDSVQNNRPLVNHIIELYRKFSFPIGAFCFVFLAVSLGLMAKRSGQTTGFIFGIIIAVIYWCMTYIGHNLGVRSGTPPFLSMWLPNILCLLTGVLLAVMRARK
jgi:lipopolysaccharide export system permease protein